MIEEPIYILGPCSAESREQVLLTARLIQETCGNVPFIFRAGAWKPRTSPCTFQGVGAEALKWLQEVQSTFGIDVATEVATPEHAAQALEAGIDYLWIGARTSATPIVVQSIADELKVKGERLKIKGIFIKNPVNADAELWLGNIERLEKTGIPVIAVHRGCGHKPCWAMAHAVRTARPDIPMLLDPSHMSGDATKVPGLMSKIAELGLDGAMVEVHCDPAKALSDGQQQLTPKAIGEWQLEIENCKDVELNWLRAEIDEIDTDLWETIAARMDVSRRIGKWKKAHQVAPLQPERYEQIRSMRLQWAQQNGIDADFVEQILNAIHTQSLKQQE